MARLGLLLLGALLLGGCASDYVARTKGVRSAYEGYRYDEAVGLLQKDEEKARAIDKLLYQLDRGMILHSAGRYPESIQALAEADKLAGQLDVVSVSEEAATLLANERERAYRGEDFERLMISTLQALNYAKLGKDDDALVEIRRVNERLRKMVAEEKKPYERLAIARYLGGVLYEDQGELDHAFIDYAEAQKLQPSLGHLAEPLLRLAKKTGREDEHRRLRALYPGVDDAGLRPDEGQVLVVLEAGRAPEKESDQVRQGRANGAQLVAIPRFKERSGGAGRGSVTVGAVRLDGVTVTSLEKVAKVHLEDRVGRMLLKSLAGTAVKAGLAAGAGALAKDERVGALTFLLLSLFNEADLRSWLSLPAEFQLARARLPAGKHSLQVQCGGRATTHPVEVRPGRIALVVERCY